ncbi:fatty-acid-binding 1 [Micractinium conductrix]|uniref:Fatty-acid-binding 1 n=1 Tax=Micractinium conductrix TaxID=554055 RepID=A0A2P6VKY2_9CHLO|nr:fatty-acid-binding 1 [Micractinium conductrix]|eukprot:PSC74761.1 fatty-acid-binding 1 [Micractinium conductrix]
MSAADDEARAAARAEIEAAVAALTPEQRESLRAEAEEALARRLRVKVDGKPTSLAKLRRRVKEQRRRYESGAYDETVRSVPRWVAQELTPGHTIRQGALKMQLRQREEAQLELDRFGRGVLTTPRPLVGRVLGPHRDVAWAIYARPNQAEAALGKQWAGRDPQEVLAGENFYLEVLQRAHQMELTLMVLTTRALPLAATRQQFAVKLESTMKSLSGEPELQAEDKAALINFVSLFDDQRLADSGFVDPSKGEVEKGTHLIFSTTPVGDLAVEAITPGRLKDRGTCRVGVNNRSKLLTGAVFGMFLGPEPLDDFGKKDVGHGMLFVANGFRFRPWEAKPGQYLAQQGPDGQLTFPQPEIAQELDLPLQPAMFQLIEEKAQRMLVGSVRCAQRRAARLDAAPA